MLSRLSLRYRIALVIFLLEAFMLASVLGVSLSRSREIATDFNAASQSASMDLLSSLSITALLTGEYTDYQLYIDDIKKQPSIMRIVLSDIHQRVVASTEVDDVGLDLDRVTTSEFASWKIKKVESAAGVLGTMAVQFSDKALQSSYLQTRNIAIAIAVTGMAIIAFVGILTGLALSRRIDVVANSARKFAEGDGSARSHVSGHDEIAQLSKNVDYMADAMMRQQTALREQNEYIELLMNSTAEAIYGADTSGICTFVNPACVKMLGYQHEDELVGKKIHDLIHHTYPDGRPYPIEECAIRRALLSGSDCHNDVEVHWRADGSSFPVEYWSHPILKNGKVIGSVVTFVDITERKRNENELTRFRAALDSSPDSIYLIDVEQKRFVDANRAGWENVGYSREELLQIGPLDLLPKSAHELFESEIQQVLANPIQHAVMETTHRTKTNKIFPVEISFQALIDRKKNEQRSSRLIVALARDITQHKKTEEELNRLAYYDSLTELPNRLLFTDRLHQAAADAKRRGRWLALMLLDIDRFKVVNDTMGHDAGDELLIEMASRLRQGIREGDTVARLGGDEFALIFTDINESRDVALIAQGLLLRLAQSMEIQKREFFPTASIGITLYPSDTEEIDTLIKYADSAMYHAKEQGRNNYQFYSQEMTEQAHIRLRMESDLRRALTRDEFMLVYQPQVEMQTGRIIGVEALLRWRKIDGTFTSPAQFIPLAEETGLIVEIGNWVLQNACAQLKTWHDAGFAQITMAVNVASRQFKDVSFSSRMHRIIKDSKVPANRIELEITESVLLENSGAILTMLNKLKQAGVTLAIDDFGTGYSSLSYLKRFPIDRVKIDQSFIRDISSDNDDLAIVKAIIAMAASLRLQVIAEGVETQEQLSLLRSEKCHAYQGYYFAKPMDEASLTALLKSNTMSSGE